MVFYFPLSFIWAWYCLRSRTLWFFSASNPTLTFGGFEGESKREMYRQLPKNFYPRSIYIHPVQPFSYVVDQLVEQAFTYPFIVKPDVGMSAILFRKIENAQQLKEYHLRITTEYIIQDLITLPYEVSVFYIRLPGASKGCITAFIQKELLSVIGDGKSTITQLAGRHPFAKARLKKTDEQHREICDAVLDAGVTFYLSHIGNRYAGASFIDLKEEIDDQLLDFFDGISHNSGFYYGRYDIKCSSPESLKSGTCFSILEFNGAGAIPNHIYTGGYTLIEAYKEIALHWKALYRISACNHKAGLKYWGFLKGLLFLKKAKKHFKHLKKLDKTMP